MKNYTGHGSGKNIKTKKSKFEKKTTPVTKSNHKKKPVDKKQRYSELSRMFEHTSDIVWLCDADLKIILINKALKNITGYGIQKVIGKEISQVLFSDDKRNFKTLEKVLKKREKGFSKKIYHSLKRKNKSDLQLETVVSSINYDRSGGNYILGITRVETNETPAQEELRKTNLSLTFAQQLAHLGIYHFDENGKNNLWSNETFKIFERDVKELTPSLEEFYRVVHPDDQSFVRNSFVNAMRNNSGFNFEHRIITSGNKTKYLHSIGRAFRNSKKSICRLSGIFMDITDRKISEENLGKYLFELKKSKELLEDKAMELASLNQQLIAASNELKKINESKDKFFSILAHDLRSPFHGLLGFSNMLLVDYDTLSDDDRKHIAERINLSALYVFKLIENLLEWSRLQSGRMDNIPARTDLHETVLYVFNLLGSTAVNKEIKLINEVPEGIEVFADNNMLISVIENLLTNAIKFSVRKSKVIIGCRYLDQFVEISVTDFGVGIKSEDLEKLFKIDSHHSTVGTSEERGTGLGLILCREMIEKMGGSLNVVSKENQGSTFTFTVPAMIE